MNNHEEIEEYKKGRVTVIEGVASGIVANLRRRFESQNNSHGEAEENAQRIMDEEYNQSRNREEIERIRLKQLKRKEIREEEEEDKRAGYYGEDYHANLRVLEQEAKEAEEGEKEVERLDEEARVEDMKKRQEFADDNNPYIDRLTCASGNRGICNNRDRYFNCLSNLLMDSDQRNNKCTTGIFQRYQPSSEVPKAKKVDLSTQKYIDQINSIKENRDELEAFEQLQALFKQQRLRINKNYTDFEYMKVFCDVLISLESGLLSHYDHPKLLEVLRKADGCRNKTESVQQQAWKLLLGSVEEYIRISEFI